MGEFTVQRGRRYRAGISLGWAESLVASSDMIKQKLEEHGFADVTVTGSGRQWVAEATWPNDDRTGEMPRQISDVTEIA